MWILIRVSNLVWTWTHVHEKYEFEMLEKIRIRFRNLQKLHRTFYRSEKWNRFGVSIVCLTLSNPLIDLERCLVRFATRKKSNIWMELAVQHYSLQIPCNVRDTHCIFWWTCSLIVFFPFIEQNLKTVVHFRQFSVERATRLTNPWVSHDLRWSITLQEVSLRTQGEEHSCKKMPLVLCPIKLVIAQVFQSQVIIQNATWFRYFWCVWTPHLVNAVGVCHHLITLLGAVQRLSKRERRARKSCGHHLLHRVVRFATRSTKNTIASGLTFPLCLKMSATWSVVGTC